MVINNVKYPDITVSFNGVNGNALNLIGIVRQALVRNHIDKSEITKFVDDATSGDYNHVLVICMSTVNVEQ